MEKQENTELATGALSHLSVELDTVYVMIIEDRHCDTDAQVFLKEQAAIDAARKLAKEECRYEEDYSEELNQFMVNDGWVFYATYSCEGDNIRVLKRKVNSI